MVQNIEGMDPAPGPDVYTESEYLYHHTSPEHRESIKIHGLLASKSYAAQTGGYGEVYLSSHPRKTKGTDVWKVKKAGLDLDDDFVQPDHKNEKWHVHYGDIPAHRLTLHHACAQRAMPEEESSVRRRDAD